MLMHLRRGTVGNIRSCSPCECNLFRAAAHVKRYSKQCIWNTDSHKRWALWFLWSQTENALFAFFLLVLSVATSGSLCPVGASCSAPFSLLYALQVLPSPQQLRSGQGWHKNRSVAFNCHYGQRCGAKATIRESHVWLPFSNPYWHTPLSLSIFSSLLPLTIISRFMFLHSQELSQGPYHALHCERCCLLLVQWQFTGLVLWSFLERCWILLSIARRGISGTLPLKGSNPAAAGSGLTWNNQGVSP